MHRFLRYGFNGVLNTALTYLLYVILVQFIDLRVAIAIVYAVGMALLYFLHGTYAFDGPGRVGAFIVVYFVLMLVNMAITWTLVHWGGWREEIAQLPAIAVAFVLGYFLNRRFVFSKSGS